MKMDDDILGILAKHDSHESSHYEFLNASIFESSENNEDVSIESNVISNLNDASYTSI